MRIRFFLPFLVATLFVSCNNEKAESSRGNKDDDKSSSNGSVDKDDSRDAKKDDDRAISSYSLVGKWQVTDFSENSESDEKDRSKDRSKPTIEFKSNGEYITDDGDSVEKGTYTFNESTKMLVSTTKDGKEEAIEIEFVNKNEFYYEYDEVKITMKRI